MKLKKVLTIGLGVFVAVAVGFLIANAFQEKAALPKTENAAAQAKPTHAATTAKANKICDPKDNQPYPPANNPASGTERLSKPTAGSPSRKVIAYYFHGNFRCSTCRTLEAYSQEAIQSGFGDALRDGSLEWHVVNVEEPANRHFVQDYKLFTKSLVLVKIQDNKQVDWKNLDRIWELVRDKPAFLQYVQNEVSAYLTK